MYICMCNPFTDKDVAEYLNNTNTTSSVRETYSVCSGGENMNCCQCANTLKAMVDKHNNTITVKAITQQMHGATAQASDTDKKVIRCKEVA